MTVACGTGLARPASGVRRGPPRHWTPVAAVLHAEHTKPSLVDKQSTGEVSHVVAGAAPRDLGHGAQHAKAP